MDTKRKGAAVNPIARSPRVHFPFACPAIRSIDRFVGRQQVVTIGGPLDLAAASTTGAMEDRVRRHATIAMDANIRPE